MSNPSAVSLEPTVQWAARNRSLLTRLAAWPALVVALLLYLPTVWYSWAADDHWYVVDKPWSALPGMFNILDPTRFFYRPLSAVSYFLSYELFGPNPHAWHAVNLGWYLLCVWLCFLFMRRLAGAEVAAVGTLLFALHPAHPGAVCWISSLSDVQAATFALLAGWAWLKYRTSGGGWLYLLVVVSITLGLMSKEAATTVPLLLLAGDVLLSGRTLLQRRAFTLLEYSGLLLPLLVYATLKSITLAGGGVILYRPWFDNVGQLVPSMLLYVLHSFGLPIYHLDGGGVVLSLLLIGGLVAVVWWLGKVAWYGLLWLVITLAPVMTTVQATNLTERTVFVPSVGSSLVLGCLLVVLYQRAKAHNFGAGRWLVGIAATLLLLLAVAGTALHSYDWYMAGEINARIIRDFNQLQPELPTEPIVYFRDVPYLYGNAYVVGNRGLNYMLRQAGGPPLRVIDKDFSTPDKFCLPGNTLYFAAAPDGSLTKLADCQQWLDWSGSQQNV